MVTDILASVTRKQKNVQIFPIFWWWVGGWGVFVKLGGGGPFYFKRYLKYSDPGERKKLKTKQLEKHEIPTTI